MAARFFLVIGLGILLSFPLGVNPPAAASGPIDNTLLDTVTVVGSDTVNAGTYKGERVTCPTGMTAVGGGVDVDNVLTMVVTSSAPTFGGSSHRLVQQPNGTNPAPVGWQATVLNTTTTAKSFKVAVICATLSEASTVVASDIAPAGTYRSEQVSCPAGKVAVGGGIDMDNVLTMEVTSSAPTFPGSLHRLFQQSVGSNPAPKGWQASALNNGTTARSFKVAAICAPLMDITTIVATDDASGGNYGTARAVCPSQHIALGGGIDMENVLTMKVTSSAPTFGGRGARLIVQPDGTQPAPSGWQAAARNDTMATKSFKVGAICGKPVSRAFLPISQREAD